MNKADRIVQHIVELQYRLCQVENNLQYIKVTQALKRSLEKFYDLLMNDQSDVPIPVNLHRLVLYWLGALSL